MGKLGDEKDFIAESLGLVSEKPEESKITVFRGSDSTTVMTFENCTEEDKEELAERRDKALAEFKKGFKGELTAELVEDITKQITQQLKVEQEKTVERIENERNRIEEEKEILRQEEFEAEIRKIEELQSKEEKVKAQIPVTETIPNPTIPTIYLEQKEGVAKKKIGFGKSLLLKFKRVLNILIDIIQWLIVIAILTLVGYILFYAINPELQAPELIEPISDWVRPYLLKFMDWVTEKINK